jgi:hypothetical protein
MLDTVIAQWVALAFIFLLASVFSERNVRFGYVLIPLMVGLFIFIGWLPTSYLAIIFPVIMGLGVVTFLKDQFHVKLGGYGSAGSLIWKIVTLLVVLQFAIVFVNGITIFDQQYIAGDTAFTDQYSITKTNLYGTYTNTSLTDQLFVAFTMIWEVWNVTWAMVLSLFGMYGNMVNVFKLHPLVAALLSMGVYIMFVFEIFILVTRPSSQPTAG